MDQENLDQIVFNSFRSNIEEPCSDEENQDEIKIIKKDLNLVFEK